MEEQTITIKNMELKRLYGGIYKIKCKDNRYDHHIFMFIEHLINDYKIAGNKIEDITNFLNEINLDSISCNLKIIYSNHNSIEQIYKIFINNQELLQNSLYRSLNIYDFIITQQILTPTQINKLLFDISSEAPIGNVFSLIELLLIKIKTNNNNLGILLQKETPELEQEIRERLEYIKIMRILEKEPVTEKEYEEAGMILNASLFDTLVKIDNESIKKIKPSYTSDTLFPGIKMALHRELEGLQEGLFDEFWECASNNSDEFNRFYQNLTFKDYIYSTDNNRTIKEATYLKNEIIAKITYSYLSYKEFFKEDLEKKVPIEIILKHAPVNLTSGAYKDEEEIIIKMLKLNPYTFDVFRRRANSSNERMISALEVKYCFCALDNGYIFTEQELDEYSELHTRIRCFIKDRTNNLLSEQELEEYLKIFSCTITNQQGETEFISSDGFLVRSNYSRNPKDYSNYQLPQIIGFKKDYYKDYKYKLRHILQYINNKIDIPKISPDNKIEYAKQVRELIRKYIRDRKNNDIKEEISNGLFEILRAIDLYLSSNNEYINQELSKGSEIIETKNRVFDRNNNISTVDRLLYSIYNLNKLAHDTTEINLKLEYVPDRFNRHENEMKEMSSYINSYNILQRYGFSMNFICHILKSSPPIKEKLLQDIKEEDSITYANYMMNALQLFIKFPYEPSHQDILDINKNFKIIAKCPNFSKIEQYAHEQALFYETKTLLAEELMLELLYKLNINVDSIITLSKAEKRRFYQENGYIIEAQKDVSGNAILVFYSKTFKEPFSIHLKSFNQELKDGIDKYLQDPDSENTISHYKIEPPGLTLRTTSYKRKKGARINNMIDKAEFCNNSENVDEAYSASLANYVNYDIYEEIIKQTKEGIFTEESFAKLLKDFEGITENKVLLKELYNKAREIAAQEKNILTNFPKTTI